MNDDDFQMAAMDCVLALTTSGVLLLLIGVVYWGAWQLAGIPGTLLVTVWWAVCFWFTLGVKLRDAYRAHFEPPDPDDVARAMPWERHR